MSTTTTAPFVAAQPRPALTPRVMLALLTVYIVWGSTYLAIHFALASFPPFLQGGLRFTAAGALLFGFLMLRGARLPSLRQWRDGAVVGILLLALGNGGVVYAEQTVSSSMAAIFIGSAPLLAALFTGAFGQWPSRTQWLGIVIGFCGVIALAGGAQLSAQPVGLAALTIAVLAWNFGSVLSQQTLKLAPGAMGFATEMLAGGAVLLLAALLRGETMVWPPAPQALIAWIYLVVAGSLIAFSAYMYLLSKVPSTLAISYAYVNPMIAVVLGALLAGEAMSLREWIATAVIVGSVVLLTRAKK